MAKKKGDYQPTKYNWIALEAEFMAGDEPSVAKFFRQKAIPQRTYYKAAVGWGEKRLLMRQKGLKLFENRLQREAAEMAEVELIASKGMTKVGVDALFPQGEGKKGLKPTTAREAAHLIEKASAIRRNVVSSIQQALKVEIETTGHQATGTDDSSPSGPVVTVSIRTPSNGRELPADG